MNQSYFDTAHPTRRPALTGVHQGYILGPELFILYAPDIPRHVQVELAIFTDDTAVHSSGRNESILMRRVQTVFEAIEDQALRWRLRINADKTVAVRFTSGLALPDSRLTIKDRRFPGLRKSNTWGSRSTVGSLIDSISVT